MTTKFILMSVIMMLAWKVILLLIIKPSNSENSTLWLYAMEEELKSMKDNEVWDLVELPKGIKTIGCKWIFKTKHDSKGNVEKIQGQLIFDLELHKMDVKTAFLNGDLHEEVYMDQPEVFRIKTKQFLSKNFDMKDLGEASYVIGVEIHRDSIAPVVKGDIFCELQCPKNDLEKKQMDKIPYASTVGSIMYAQVCTRLDIAYVVGMLGRYQSNSSIDHWKAVKKVLRYLQGTKDYMLTYKRTDNLEIIGYSDSDYAGCKDTRKSTSGYIFYVIKWTYFTEEP
ncbi:Retrovirus-related Pol polyprotein from transposon TNT 1-94 [Vitis vinifera]|uniref:Retrovirus-related Pol polyprotein from transposon TNT 1-94 n=1 Tax=Vitis vinifera TaxID=29760 RepID=A0A438GQX5_VITVI|nr:Retrovirus-related Pol polyprotein from transposon TNT 1-94 [Vitis vinifera]